MRPDTPTHGRTNTPTDSGTSGDQLTLTDPDGLDRPDLIGQEEVAQLLDVGLRTVQRMVADGRLDTIEIGTKRYILRQPLQHLIDQHPPAPPREADDHPNDSADHTNESPEDDRQDESPGHVELEPAGDAYPPTELIDLHDEPSKAATTTDSSRASDQQAKRRHRQRLLLIAALVALATSGAALALTLRGDDTQPASEPSTPIPAAPEAAPETGTTRSASPPESSARPDPPAPAPQAVPEPAPPPEPRTQSTAPTPPPDNDTAPAATPVPLPTQNQPLPHPPRVAHTRHDGPDAETETTSTETSPAASSATASASPAPKTPAPALANPTPTPPPPAPSKPKKGPGDNVCRAMGLCP